MAAIKRRSLATENVKSILQDKGKEPWKSQERDGEETSTAPEKAREKDGWFERKPVLFPPKKVYRGSARTPGSRDHSLPARLFEGVLSHFTPINLATIAYNPPHVCPWNVLPMTLQKSLQ